MEMKLDKTGLEDRTFEAFSITAKRSYIFLCNMGTNVSRWSADAVEYFNLPGEFMYDAGEIWKKYIHPDDLPQYLKNFDAVYNKKTKWQDFEYRAKNRFGNYVVCTCQCTVLEGTDGEPDLFSGTILNHGIVDSIDSVTNLYSDYAFIQKLMEITVERKPAIVMEIGINMFSRINFLYGYSNGNNVMRQMGDILRELIKGKGIVYRLDGAKFALCIEGSDENAARELYEKIQSLIKNNIKVKGVVIPVRISASAVVLDRYIGSFESVKSSLAYALNRSKHEKHGELQIFNEVRIDNDGDDLELISVIHMSIQRNCEGFYLKYQPIVNVENGKIIGMEALLRWKNEQYGEVPPNRFIPWMEEDPGFFELGNWILKQALTDGLRIKKKIPSFIVNVNISLSQFERPEFRESVNQILEQTKFQPQDLCLELTERCRDLDSEFLKDEMNYFRSLGIKIALDDFGTGTASLALLLKLPIDELKIDMSFVKGIHDKPLNQTLVHHMVECANGIGVKTCIEGVEDEFLCNYLDKYNATFYQGYYYSKPVVIDSFEKLL